MTGQDWLDTLKAVGIVCTALGGVLGFTTKWWLPLWRGWGDARRARAAMPGQLATLLADFREHRDFVDHELRPNNSTSIRDAVDRIERQGHVAIGMIRHSHDANRNEGAFETDERGLTVWVNATFLRWTGRQSAEVVGWGWINTVLQADRERLRDEWEDAITEQRAFSSTYRLLDAEGVPFAIDCRANPIRDGRGNVVKWMGTVTRRPAQPAQLPHSGPPEASFM